MKYISRMNAITIKRGVNPKEDFKGSNDKILELKPKKIFEKGIMENNYGKLNIPIVFAGQVLAKDNKLYQFEIVLVVTTDENDKYKDSSMGTLDRFNDIAEKLLSNFNEESSEFRTILYDCIDNISSIQFKNNRDFLIR